MASASHPLHVSLLSWGAVPKLVLGDELFYDTKGIFPKHNLGRDVARYCEPCDWYKSKKRFFLNARGIVALAFGKKILDVRPRRCLESPLTPCRCKALSLACSASRTPGRP